MTIDAIPKTSWDCPKCGKRGHRRKGVHFDHEVRCGTCDISWEPEHATTSWSRALLTRLEELQN